MEPYFQHFQTWAIPLAIDLLLWCHLRLYPPTYSFSQSVHTLEISCIRKEVAHNQVVGHVVNCLRLLQLLQGFLFLGQSQRISLHRRKCFPLAQLDQCNVQWSCLCSEGHHHSSNEEECMETKPTLELQRVHHSPNWNLVSIFSSTFFGTQEIGVAPKY